MHRQSQRSRVRVQTRPCTSWLSEVFTQTAAHAERPTPTAPPRDQLTESDFPVEVQDPRRRARRYGLAASRGPQPGPDESKISLRVLRDILRNGWRPILNFGWLPNRSSHGVHNTHNDFIVEHEDPKGAKGCDRTLRPTWTPRPR